jgi:hypothetical protein
MSDPKRKLTFDRGKAYGKLKFRFEDGAFSIEPPKRANTVTLSTTEAQELALWLSAWSLKVMEGHAPDVEETAVTSGVIVMAPVGDSPRRKKRKKRHNALRTWKQPATVHGQEASAPAMSAP